MSNHILLPRSALGDELWRDKDLGRLFLYLLSKSDENGACHITSGEIQNKLEIPRQRFRTLLEKLVSNQLLTKSATKSATNICFEIQQVKPKRQPTKQPREQPSVNQVKPTRFIPPTDEEVTAFVAERGYHFNPEQFVPHYQSKGWKVGNQPMKDWRAACRTWEASWKEKYGERFYYEVKQTSSTDNAVSRKARRDQGLSLATTIVAGSENLLNLFNGGGADSNDSQD